MQLTLTEVHFNLHKYPFVKINVSNTRSC